MDIKWIIVPHRDIEEVIASRLRNGNEKGGFYWGATDASSLRSVVEETDRAAQKFLAESNIPCIHIDFKKMISDKDYLWAALLPVLKYLTPEPSRSLFDASYDESVPQRPQETRLSK